jgi:hypothetical protein
MSVSDAKFELDFGLVVATRVAVTLVVDTQLSQRQAMLQTQMILQLLHVVATDSLWWSLLLLLLLQNYYMLTSIRSKELLCIYCVSRTAS